MALIKTDSRQLKHDSLLDYLANKANFDSELPAPATSVEEILESINEALKPPMRLQRDDSNALKINVENVIRTSSQTSLERTIVPTSSGIPSFTSGNVIFPSVSAGLISITPGSSKSLVITGSYYRKAAIVLLDNGNLDVELGVEAATEQAATLPQVVNMAGFVTLQNVAGNIQINKLTQFDHFDSGIQIQNEGINVTRRPTLNFRGDVIIVDTGTRLDITIPLGTPRLVDNDGNSIIKLQPKDSEWTLQSPDLNKWDISISPAGELIATSGSSRDVSNIKIQRDDLTEVSFSIDNSGGIQVVEPADVGASLESSLKVTDSNDDVWLVHVDNTNTIYTSSSETYLNYLAVQNDRSENLFVVREIETDRGALLYAKIIDATQLASVTPPPSYAGTAPYIMYDDGVTVEPIFYDTRNSLWKRMIDGSAV